MKKLIFNLVFLTITCALFFTSCTKDNSFQKNVAADLLMETSEFQESLTHRLTLLKENESLLIQKNQDEFVWEEIRTSQNLSFLRKHDCENEKATPFALCVGKLIEDRKCVTVGISNGSYWGDVVDCP